MKLKPQKDKAEMTVIQLNYHFDTVKATPTRKEKKKD